MSDPQPLTLGRMKAHWDAAAGLLNTASLGLPTREAAALMHAEIDDWASGRATAPGYDGYVERARAAYARLAGTDPGRVAIGSQVSVMVGLLASAVPAGGEVLTVEGDFTSVVYPFLAHADRGVRVRHAPLEKLAESIDSATTVVAYSLVQSADGRVASVESIRRAAAAVGATTLCDVTQAAGWLPFDAEQHDLTVGAAYKWLCSPRGVAFLTASPELSRRLRPTQAGWYAGASVWDSIYGHDMRLADGARRFDVSPAWLCWAGAALALETFAQADLRAVHDHDVSLADSVLTALGREPGGSAIVSLPDPDGTLLARFAEAGLSVSARAGRVRVSFHVYNDEDDAQRVIDVARGVLW